MPKSGEHNVNNIDSFFRVRPSRTNLREGETVSFLEDGKLVKQEKRNGVVYEIKLNELGKQETALTKTDESSSSTVFYGGDITNVVAGTGLSGGGSSGSVVLDIDSTVATLTGTQTFTNKTIDLDSNTLTGTLSEFNTALQGDSFVSLTGTETLTNKTLASPSLTGTTTGVNLTLSGNLIVNGTTITIDTDTLAVQDPLIKLAKANSVSDTVDIGFYGLYDTSGSQDLYAGLFRDADDGKFKLFKDLQTEPTSTVNVSGTGYTTGTLVASLEGNASTATALSNSGTLTITGDVTANVTPTYTGGGDLVITLSINDNSIGTDELNVATAGLSGQFLTSNADGSFSWTSNTDIFQIESGTNTNNNVLTATGLDDTIRGESGLTFDSTTNQLTIGTGGSLYLNTTQVINSSGNWVGGGNISQFTNNVGYITGNQTITLSGDVTGSGTTSIATTIAQNVITDYELNVTTGSSGQFLTSNGVGGFTWTDSTSVFSVETGTNTNNYLLTATGLDDTIRGEANLTFDGSTLALTGDLNIGSGDFFVDDSAGQIGIGTTSPNTLLHLYSTSNTQLRLQTTGTNNASNIVYQNGSASYSVGINSAEQFSFYSSQLSGDAGFINTNGWLYWYNPILLTTNNTALKGRDSGGIVRDMLKIDANNDLVIGDSGLNDVYINQNVGIGTSSPQSKLNINVAAESAIPSAGNDTTFLMIGNDGSGTTNYGTMIGTLNTGNGYIQQQRFDGTATTYNLLLQPNGGNVGIGTQSPSAKFEVVGGNLRWKSTDDANTGVQIYSSNGNRQLSFYGYLTSYSALQSDNTSTYKIIQNYSDGDIQFIVKPSSTGVQTEVMRLDGATANVGIGTASPGAKLHVDGSAIFDTDTGNQPFYITRIGTLGQALKIYVDDNDAVFESIQDETVGTVGNFKFVMDSDTAANTRFLHGTAEKFKIESGGNVVMQQGSRLYLDGGGDTYIQSDIADTLRMVAGNINMLEMIEDDTQDQVIIGNGTNDVDFIVEDDAGVTVFKVDAGTSNTTITGDLDVSGALSAGSFGVTTLNVTTIKNNDSPADTAMTIDSSGRVTFSGGPTISSGGINVTGASTMGAISMSGGNLSNVTDINLSGILYMDSSILIDTNRRFRNSLSAVGADIDNSIHVVDFATPDTPGATGWYTICKASSANARGGGIINLSATGGSITPTTITIDFFVDWSGNLVRCNTQGISGQFSKVRLIETASTTELQIYVATTVVQAVYVSFEKDRYNPSYSLLDPWATATPTTTGDEVLLRNTSIYSPINNTSALVVSDNARRLLLGRDSIQSTDLSGTTQQLYINSNTTFSGTITTGGQLAINDTNAILYRNSNDLEIKTYGGYDINLMPAGNVGIGTVSPAGKLHIDQSSDNVLIVSDNPHSATNATSGISFGGHSNGNVYVDSKTHSGGSILFRCGEGTEYGYARTWLNVDPTNGDVRLANDGQNLYLGAGNDLRLLHSGTESYIYNYSGALYVGAVSTDQDVFIRGNDGGASINALQFDMSDAGTAIFNHDIWVKTDLGELQLGAGKDGRLYSYNDDLYIDNQTLDQDIHLRVNDGGVYTTALFIDGDTSRVGIGTTSPGYKLDISHPGEGLRLNSTGDLQIRFDRSGGNAFSIEHDTSRIYLYNRTTSLLALAVTNANNVGIGTASPGNKLEVRGDIAVAISDTQDIIKLSDAGNDGSIEIYTGEATPVLRTKIVSYGDTYFNAASTGRVGIGTSSPDSKLQVEYTTTSNGSAAIAEFGTSGSGAIAGSAHQVIVGGPSVSDYTGIQIFSDTTTGKGVLSFADGRGANDNWRGVIQYDHSSNDMEFWTNATEKMKIDSAGHVGINETNPSTELHLGTCPDARAITFDQSGRFNGIGNYFSSNATDSRIDFFLSSGATDGTTNQEFAMYSSGNFHADADVIAYSTSVGSDIKLKKNVKDISYGLNDVLKMRAVEFDWKEKRQGKHDIGFIAQEIEKIIPEVVQEVNTLKTDGDTHKVVDYAKLTSVLIKAIQEQQQQINELKEKLNG